MLQYNSFTDEILIYWLYFLELKTFSLSYIEKDYKNFSGKLINMPERNEIPIEVNEVLVVELYSK